MSLYGYIERYEYKMLDTFENEVSVAGGEHQLRKEVNTVRRVCCTAMLGSIKHYMGTWLTPTCVYSPHSSVERT